MKKKGTMHHTPIVHLLVFIVFLFSSCISEEPVKEDAKHSDMSYEKHKDVKRIGMLIKIKPDKLDDYIALHADTNAGVRHLLSKYNMRNFSIFMTQLEDGNYYEFGYWEYWGNDYEGDMQKIEAEPENKAWLILCDPMQIPLEGETSWRHMKRIYHNY